MKILGWILTLLGSNGLTAALVARQSIRYDMSNLAESIMDRITDFIGTDQGFVGNLLAHLTDNLSDNLADNLEGLLGTDHEYVRMINTLLYISIGVLALGVALLIVGYIRAAIKKRQPQQVAHTPSGQQVNQL